MLLVNFYIIADCKGIVKKIKFNYSVGGTCWCAKTFQWLNNFKWVDIWNIWNEFQLKKNWKKEKMY